MNFWDILILSVIAALAGTAIVVLRRSNKKGSCSCGCGGCNADCNLRKSEKTAHRKKTNA